MISPSATSAPALLTVPPEVLLSLSSYLPYPDVLALRLTHPRFYYSSLLATDRNIRLKVAWLLERKVRGLPCPSGGRAIVFRTDRDFVASGMVGNVLKRRRGHRECAASPGGCQVVAGKTCGRRRLGKRARVRPGWEMLWNLAMLLGMVMVAWNWRYEEDLI